MKRAVAWVTNWSKAVFLFLLGMAAVVWTCAVLFCVATIPVLVAAEILRG